MERLLSFYRQYKRDLPWRDSKDPYDVWLSEIMLQQTRVEAVISYFLRFKREVPDIETLASIDEDRLLRLWEGLGYYSRARNLKRCAQILVEKYNGSLPQDYKELLSLPGIGPYTAGAIMAIGFGKPYPAVDGNVLRVLARYFGIKENIRSKDVFQKLEETIRSFYEENGIEDPTFIVDLSQAFMDLGAVVCVPNGSPDCAICPLKENCFACKKDAWDCIPFRSKDKERRIEDRTLFVIRDAEKFLLRKRPDKGLLAGMYEFPGAEGKLDEKKALVFMKEMGYEPIRIKRLPDSRHLFSHIEWRMRAYEVIVGDWPIPAADKDVLVDRMELQDLAIPSAFGKYTEYYSLRKEEKR